MLTNFRREKKSVIVIEEGENVTPIGKFFDFVIDPDTGKCEAIWVQSFVGMKILFPQDIQFWQEGIIKVNSEDDLRNPDEEPKLKAVFDREVPVIYAPVFEEKANLGQVINFAFDTISPRILSLIVQKGFWIFGTSRIINYKNIVAITEDGIQIEESNITGPGEPKDEDGKKEGKKPRSLVNEPEMTESSK